MQLLVPAEQQEVEEAGPEEHGAAVEALAEGGERDLVEGGADPHGLEDEGEQAEAELEDGGEAGPGLHAAPGAGQLGTDPLVTTGPRVGREGKRRSGDTSHRLDLCQLSIRD